MSSPRTYATSSNWVYEDEWDPEQAKEDGSPYERGVSPESRRL